ncbi:MAG: HD-GYP domain-containing protein [Planctomycetota bacterium]
MLSLVRPVSHARPGTPIVSAESGEKYILVLSEGLRVDTMVDFDLYLKSEQNDKFVLYRHKDLPFGAENAERLKSQKGTQLFIDAADRERYLAYIEQHLPEILADGTIARDEKSVLLYESASSMVSQMFRKPEAPENLRRAGDMVTNVSGFIIGDKEAFQNLFSIASHDYYTYTHSVNVCTYGLATAASMGIENRDILHDFGVGALLHDIGKAKISEDIICKPGSLDTNEWEEVKRHPLYGGELLKVCGGVSSGSMEVVLGHHEKIDGSGYPEGLSGSEVPMFARLAAVVDVYDALTTVRSYKNAMNSFDALMLMGEKMGKQLDRDVYEHFVWLIKE